MKKITINEPNIESVSHNTELQDAKYLITYDNISTCYDGQDMNYVDIYTSRYSIDVENFLVDYCEERGMSDAIGYLYVYEVVDPTEVGFTLGRKERYTSWWNNDGVWQTYYKTLDEFLASMKEKDDKEASTLIELIIDNATLFIMPREVEYGVRLTAQIQ